MSSERQALNTQSPWWGEHVHRYDVVIKEMQGDETILDIACGTGFGSDMLAKYTKNQVIGGDIDKESIQDCRARWNKSNLKFEAVDGTNLYYDDHHFDLVVSFETIEHTTEYRKMLSEFARVLKPKGTAFISTPNFPINSPTGVVTNPYHTQEFIFEELRDILNENFKNVSIYGQKYIRYTKDGDGTKSGKVLESLLYQRGVRKLPIYFQDKLMKFISGNKMYPNNMDYKMVDNIQELKLCKTFFAICNNKK